MTFVEATRYEILRRLRKQYEDAEENLAAARRLFPSGHEDRKLAFDLRETARREHDELAVKLGESTIDGILPAVQESANG